MENKGMWFQAARFAVVGVANTAIDFLVFFLLTYARHTSVAAQIISYAAGTFNSFLCNRKWTFRVTKRATGKEIISFLSVNGLSLLVSIILLEGMQQISVFPLIICKAVATAGSLIVNYLGTRKWVFQTRSE
ncbi:GtrA family protein [Paenibacillus roseipurpureus]|uniref:GtrA family protein n=1 Tax=Paenibacillus roseopurpureus TaxID=2918901 RepID=A0AA96LSR7_9BACL|nr:GtrA family protein [Paenibacillus sp. MBLB1832]WNR44050.1 GtrA family protein [Paenibacillus sp. MBLB1832]